MGPATLGVNEYDMGAPLTAIRRLMLESNGILVVAFARYFIKSGSRHYMKDDSTCGTESISGKWQTSPWCQIEAGMGFQLGLPILILRENRVLPDGVLDKGVIGNYMPEFNLTDEPSGYFATDECRQLLQQFESKVLNYRHQKGFPPNYS